MKKGILFALLAFFAISASAQRINVESAISDLRSKQLKKAKENIDAACEHEDTKNDAKTWQFKAYIYYELAITDVKKYKGLATNPLQTAYEAAFKSMELDKEKEYLDKNTTVLQAVSRQLYASSIDTFNAKNYGNAAKGFETVVIINNRINNVKDKDITIEAQYLTGLSSESMNDTTNAIKSYQEVTRLRYKKPWPYTYLYQVYRKRNDTINAIKIAERFVKNMPDTSASHMVLATAYAWSGNKIKVKAELDSVVAKSKNLSPNLLVEIGQVLENAGYDSAAMEKYKEVLKIDGNNYAANFYLGRTFFNKGADKISEANNLPVGDKREPVLINEAKECFNNAIPYFDKAIAIEPNNLNTLYALKQIYFRLNNTEKANEIEKRMQELQNSSKE